MLVAIAVLTGLVACTQAYIPAVPSNNTDAVNQTDMSMLTIRWAPAGIYSNIVSYQLAGEGSNGFNQGALVHFSEKSLTDQITTTPWIAFVDCDANTTDASQEDDIFTLARDRGAVAALLYSTTSLACLINPEYASPDNFEQILDIFATQSKSSAQIITSQFSNLHNSSFGNFDALQLNNSADAVRASIQTNNITSPFLIATLRSANSTVSPNGTDASPDGSGSDPPKNNPNTGLAMIILYAITGCVSGLFIIVILSGAIRAIRHPERYGPRSGNANGGPGGATRQTRTGGIGRAILDTFPIIKFGQASPERAPATPEVKSPDVENQTGAIEMNSRPIQEKIAVPITDDERAEASSSSSPSPGTPNGLGSLKSPDKDVQPGAIGHETCPICIVDFESGDDLRVLPCEGKHKFHQACVDPWLLELSSSCPLCREDFHALETMMARAEDESSSDGVVASSAAEQSAPSSRTSRFTKYLKFARRRNRDAQETTPSQLGSERGPDA